jgi:hypothetical protein
LIKINLTAEDLALCHDAAERHYQLAVIGGKKNRHGLAQDQGREKDIQIAATGLAGELAFCKQFGYPFNPWLEKDADVGRAIEIRTTHYPRGKLIWRPSTDKEEHAYVLIRCPNPPEYEIVGWTTGRGAKMLGIFEDPCRYLKRKPREEVYWVTESKLCKDWEVLESFYYGKESEQGRPEEKN